MKNLVIAVIGLVILIIVIFIFATKNKSGGDTFIPSPEPVKSPEKTLDMKNESSESAQQLPFPVLKSNDILNKKIVISTQKGNIVIELFDDSLIASSNFINLVNKGFYDGLTFHRREEGFVIQGGDPKGDGTGGPGYSFPDEKVTRDYKRGIIAMANAGPNTNGSQFFIMLKDAPQLPKQYTIFGQVTEGMDTVDKIIVGDKMLKLTVE